jgi:hypothetical protein
MDTERNQFDELISYLNKMVVDYTAKDKSGTMDYTDDAGEKKATYTKEVTIGPNHITTARYIPEFDGFVDPADDTNDGNYNLFVMDAWETARWLGTMYFGEDAQDTEKRMN